MQTLTRTHPPSSKTRSSVPPEGVILCDVLRLPHLVLTKSAVAALVDRFQKA